MRVHSTAARRRAVVAISAMALAATCAGLAPGTANAGPTTVTFSITAGALTISNPATAALGSAAAGGTISTQLGAVTVTDLRSSLVAAWTATAVSTAFTTGGGSPAETVPATAVSYASGTATATSGVGVFTPGQATTAEAVPIDTAKTAYTLTSGTGNNSATWNPTLIITLPAAAVTGPYTGTVTHSVA